MKFLRALNWPNVFIALAVVILVGSLGWGLWDLLQAPGRAKAAQAGQVIAEGQAASGREAVGVVSNRAATEAATDVITRTNADEIRKAPGADAPVDPALAAAGRRSLCKRKAYSHDPLCLLHPDP